MAFNPRVEFPDDLSDFDTIISLALEPEAKLADEDRSDLIFVSVFPDLTPRLAVDDLSFLLNDEVLKTTFSLRNSFSSDFVTVSRSGADFSPSPHENLATSCSVYSLEEEFLDGLPDFL